MGYKTILVHAQDDPAAEGRMELALSLACRFEATVFGVGAELWYPLAGLPEYGFVPGEVTEGLERESLQRLGAAHHRCNAAVKAAGRPVLWASELDFPADALIRHARAADLIVTSRPKPPFAEARVVRPADLVMGAGLPVLVKSDASSTFVGEHVVIGWKNTRECRRAISEAMPILQLATGVTLAQVAREGDLEAARADLEEAAGRLQRQGVRVLTEAIPARGHVCETLDALAASRGADLIVLGGYGHSRWRETVFGGVTEGFLERSAVHVLFSH